MTSNIKNSSNQSGKLIRTILNMQNFPLKKLLFITKKLYFEEKIADNKNNPKELWRTLKSLGMPSKVGRQSKISLKENVSSPLIERRMQIFFVGFSQT